jgi:uncharacterized protein YdaU (DUF1376 family)
VAALPYIQLYAADYLADTVHLTLEEHGAYLLLILNYWQRGEALLDDDRRLAAICRIPVKSWLILRPGLEEFFSIINGKWSHKRLDLDLMQVAKQQNQRVAAGRASANSRKRKENLTVVQRSFNEASVGRSTNKDTDTDTDTDKIKSVVQAPQKTERKKTATPYSAAVKIKLDWMPNEKAVEWILSFGISMQQANPVIVEFRNYWLQRSTRRKSWSLAFMRNSRVEGSLIRLRDGNGTQAKKSPATQFMENLKNA